MLPYTRLLFYKSHTFISLAAQTGSLAYMMCYMWVMGIGQIKNLYSTEEQTHCLTHWGQTALQNGPPTSLEEATVDGEGAEVGGETPDVVEGYAGKVYPPKHGQATSKETGETFVAAVLTTVEAFVRVPPHTVTRVNAVWLT